MTLKISDIIPYLNELERYSDSQLFVMQHAMMKRELRSFLADQISLRKKAQKKLPYYAEKGCLYSKKALEQSTSEMVANHKINFLYQANPFQKCIDLTGGLGVDSFTFSKFAQVVHYLEADAQTFDLASYNFTKLEVVQKVQAFNQKAEVYLAANSQKYDLLYADPDRRALGKRDFRHEASSPNPLWIESEGLKHAQTVVIKHSPMLDMEVLKKDFEWITRILVISHKNEVKEVVSMHQKKIVGEIPVTVISINADGEATTENFIEHIVAEETDQVLDYFIEPDKAIIKSGFQDVYAAQMGFKRISSKNIPYYTHKEKPYTPLGKALTILFEEAYSEKRVKEIIKTNNLTHAAIAARGFPQKAEVLEKNFKLKSGDKFFLIFYLNTKGEKRFLLGKRI